MGNTNIANIIDLHKVEKKLIDINGERGQLPERIVSINEKMDLALSYYYYDSVLKSMKGCDVVFHLAALIGIPYSYISPLAYLLMHLK